MAPASASRAISAGDGSVSASTCEPGHGHTLAAARHLAIGPKRPIPIAERLGRRGFLLRRLSYASRRPKLFTEADLRLCAHSCHPAKTMRFPEADVSSVRITVSA